MITRSNSGLYSSCLLKQNFPPCLSKQRKTQFSTLIVQAKILKRLYSIHNIFIFVEFMRGYLSSLNLNFFLDRLILELKLTIYYFSCKTLIIAQKLNLYIIERGNLDQVLKVTLGAKFKLMTLMGEV